MFGISQINMSFDICEVKSKANLESSETQKAAAKDGIVL